MNINPTEGEKFRKAVDDFVREGSAQPPDKATFMSDDPWAHRNQGMRCHGCMWFTPKPPAESPYYTLGRCRRHAPVVGQGWPVVFVHDWCGDHKLDETKI